MIFFNSNTKDAMRSFSLPFVNVSDLQLKQPLFGANYIQGTVKAEPNGTCNSLFAVTRLLLPGMVTASNSTSTTKIPSTNQVMGYRLEK
ncbi:hypothetical protein HPB48_007773 [Haemaphysalis longicornis]|uniref:Uncharacterized protein n=1 Tax=Haemaphysalis longicornis TaxID=44386 RepID=A0A9J6FPA3_HAELO|nr:hypothetical protein HPB48_007773 [Haemaphysalis longicornis]